ncbi:hypothetical protein CR51_31795 [Caballeronia megalochromosomata]|nr:hypothetical protein CR51_31795 [Caballeronia megalochromosomata]
MIDNIHAFQRFGQVLAGAKVAFDVDGIPFSVIVRATIVNAHTHATLLQRARKVAAQEAISAEQQG